MSVKTASRPGSRASRRSATSCPLLAVDPALLPGGHHHNAHADRHFQNISGAKRKGANLRYGGPAGFRTRSANRGANTTSCKLAASCSHVAQICRDVVIAARDADAGRTEQPLYVEPYMSVNEAPVYWQAELNSHKHRPYRPLPRPALQRPTSAPLAGNRQQYSKGNNETLPRWPPGAHEEHGRWQPREVTNRPASASGSMSHLAGSMSPLTGLPLNARRMVMENMQAEVSNRLQPAAGWTSACEQGEAERVWRTPTDADDTDSVVAAKRRPVSAPAVRRGAPIRTKPISRENPMAAALRASSLKLNMVPDDAAGIYYTTTYGDGFPKRPITTPDVMKSTNPYRQPTCTV